MTGSFCTPAQFIASWKSPREVEPSPNQVSATRCSPRSLKAIARPVATSIMSGSIETIPTQPTVRSPKCTLPSRPRVMPPSRPMYWPRMRAAPTPRMTCAARSRCRMHSRSRGAHRPRRSGGHGLLAEAVVEGSRHLALPVERHRPLLDAPHHEHGPQQPDPVLLGQVLGYVGEKCRLRGLGRHLACIPFLFGTAGRDRRTATTAAGRGLRTTRRRTSPRREGYGMRPRLRLGSMQQHGLAERRQAWRRMRWRMRGAWQWPTFFAAHVIDGAVLSAAALLRATGPAASSPASCSRASPTCRGRRAGAALRPAVRRRRPRPAEAGRVRLRGHRARQRDPRAARGGRDRCTARRRRRRSRTGSR